MTKTEVHHHEFKAKVVADLDAMLKEPGKYSSGYAVDRVYEAGYVAGMAMARRLLRLQLGLGVPEDTEAEPAPLTEQALAEAREEGIWIGTIRRYINIEEWSRAAASEIRKGEAP
jgi:hypothetical protein